MKILLIHGDENPWATYNRCVEFKKRWIDDEVTIANYHALPNGNEFDVIHVMFSGGIGQIAEYIQTHREKTWTTLASQRTLDFVYDTKEKLTQVYTNCKGIVCQNPALANRLLGLIGDSFKDKVFYIPNGVDEVKFDRKFVAGFVGADQATNPEHKGFPLAKQACDELGIELKRVHNGYPNDVKPHDTMPDFYKEIDCLIIPSMSEGCNNPTLEALAMNKPVISTRCGIAEHLDGVTLVERNVESVKGALRKLCPRIQILEEYTWDKIANKYINLYVEKQRT
jgi:hypothetical protein